MEIVIVASIGPPPVIPKIMSNTRNVHTVSTIIVLDVVALKFGSVIYRNLWNGPAPSMLACSYCSWGIVVSAD